MTDVVIIGGGIAGMSACAQLAHYVKVVLLEAEPELCYHSSGRSAATYIEDYGNCLLYTSPSPRDLSTSRMPSSA